MSSSKDKTIKVMASGVFDILHQGHLYYLKKAKKLGQHLTVVIAADETVQNKKGYLINQASERAALVEALEFVDEVVIGNPHHHMRTIQKINPDIIALGYDQDFDKKYLRKTMAQVGVNPQIIRLKKFPGGDNKTKKIIKKIIQEFKGATNQEVI